LNNLRKEPVSLPSREPITNFSLRGMARPFKVLEADQSYSMKEGEVNYTSSYLLGYFSVSSFYFKPNFLPFSFNYKMFFLITIIFMVIFVIIKLAFELLTFPLEVSQVPFEVKKRF
jgi:hypothetical protein